MTGTIQKSLVVNAPPAVVFKALTSENDLTHWFPNIARLEPRVGGSVEFRFTRDHKGRSGLDHRVVGKVLEFVPDTTFSMSWKNTSDPDFPDTTVTWTLEPAGNERTRVTLVHAGFEKGSSWFDLHDDGWSYFTVQLAVFCKDNTKEIRKTIIIDAPRELVFNMWTDPEHVTKWWGPRGFTTTIYEMDVRPGGVWRFVMHGPDGTDYQNKIIYDEIVKPERIVYSHVSGPQFRVTATFDEQEDGKTKLTMRMLFESAGERDNVVKKYGAIEGLNQTLERLVEQLAKVSAERQEFVITRVFDAPRDLVWEAFAESERLARWWGPKGFAMLVNKLDFHPGGIFHFSLRSPDGQEMWGKFVYREIVKPERIVFVNSFSDKDGNTTRGPFSATWPLEILSTLTFSEDEKEKTTTLTLRWRPINATEQEHRTFEAEFKSMQQGFGGTFDQLTEYLAKHR
ncbi:hypothetical protein NTE_00447 [Candidatus Nitrososphaera evergladensis SR1]|uniref:Activator of Hsp90 ATPase homologue 1/2-like C-terminal domain-containing protein n=1 Tax=Candidatus Nitrososphaera evergladensis SR1 TaxID=1459636 RepID=A0A075MT85_9ARCH|nr:SRPBCC domain-containing protein [Candidatus Nitrososphaera evergladensis]AIF82529.1 hypothetical protein NTE_00447 [Candidatus Nitrososphaera evergladensis SR1]